MTRFRSTSRGGIGPLLIASLCAIVATGAVAFALYVVQVRQPRQQYVNDSAELSLRMSGLASPVVNKLDARYADANNNLVADPPDVSQQVDPDPLIISYVATEDPEAF